MKKLVLLLMAVLVACSQQPKHGEVGTALYCVSTSAPGEPPDLRQTCYCWVEPNGWVECPDEEALP